MKLGLLFEGKIQSVAMRKLVVLTLLLFCFLWTNAQKSADVGIRIGAAAYWGDVEQVDYSKSITPLYGILGRWNFNKRMSIRGQLVTGNLKAYGVFPGANLAEPSTRITINDPMNPVNIPYELYLKKTDDSYNFIRSIQTFEAIFEFNFKDYAMGNLKKDRFTPFLSIGVGGFFSRAPRRGTLVLQPQIISPLNLFAYKNLHQPVLDGNNNKTNDSDALSPIIPMGFGFKYNLTKRLGMCMELCVRKTFTDNIDNLKDPKRFQNVDPLTGTYPDKFSPGPLTNNDWYASLHLSLHYQVWTDKGVCKVNEKPVKKNAF